MNVNLQEKLEEDIQRLLVDAENIGSEEAKNLKDKTISILNKVISKLGDAEKTAITSVRDMSSTADQFVHHKPWAAIAIAGLVGGLIGVIIERRRQ